MIKKKKQKKKTQQQQQQKKKKKKKTYESEDKYQFGAFHQMCFINNRFLHML